MMLLAHRLRGHGRPAPFRVSDKDHPWRWQCPCGAIFGGDTPFRRRLPAPTPAQPVDDEIEKVATDIVNVVRQHTPCEEDIEKLDQDNKRGKHEE